MDNSRINHLKTDRQNILNNKYVIQQIENEVGLKGVIFDDQIRFTNKQIINFFEVSQRTINTYLKNFEDELKENGYEVITGKRLQFAKVAFGQEVDFLTKTTKLGLYNFKAFLNLAMLLQESEKAKILRSLILDITLDVLNEKVGGSTKYINQRDESFLLNLYAGENYRKDFINALKNYVDMGNIKYALYTNKIYKSIFKEHAEEYREVLQLTKNDNVRDTMYSEVLTIIASYEAGLSDELRSESKRLNRKLKSTETDEVFKRFEGMSLWKPQMDNARRIMASRDYALRKAHHEKLTDYITSLNTDDFERFLGEKSKELSERIEEYQEVFKRLRDK